MSISREVRGWVVPLARFGYAAKGVVYVIIGVISAVAAFEAGRGGTTGSRGALVTILRQPYGQVLLGAVAVGLIGYAIWRLVQAWEDTENKGTDAKGLAARIGYAVVGLIYASLALSAVRLILGSGTTSQSDGQGARGWTAWLMSKPFGPWLVAGVGAAIVGFALYQFYKAATKKFREKLLKGQMSETALSAATYTGVIGLAARGVAFLIIGGFILWAAVQTDAGEVRGLSGALQTLEQQPFGPWLLGAVSAGLVAYGVFMFFLAAYRRIVFR